MEPAELIGEFYDWEPEGTQAGHLISPDGMDDSIYVDMEHDRRRVDRLLLAGPDGQCLTPHSDKYEQKYYGGLGSAGANYQGGSRTETVYKNQLFPHR